MVPSPPSLHFWRHTARTKVAREQHSGARSTASLRLQGGLSPARSARRAAVRAEREHENARAMPPNEPPEQERELHARRASEGRAAPSALC